MPNRGALSSARSASAPTTRRPLSVGFARSRRRPGRAGARGAGEPHPRGSARRERAHFPGHGVLPVEAQGRRQQAARHRTPTQCGEAASRIRRDGEMSGALLALLFAPLAAAAASGDSACAACHVRETSHFPGRRWRRRSQTVESCDILKSHPDLQFQEGPYHTQIKREGDRSIITVTRRAPRPLPFQSSMHWARERPARPMFSNTRGVLRKPRKFL